jgi:hypothetical protein
MEQNNQLPEAVIAAIENHYNGFGFHILVPQSCRGWFKKGLNEGAQICLESLPELTSKKWSEDDLSEFLDWIIQKRYYPYDTQENITPHWLHQDDKYHENPMVSWEVVREYLQSIYPAPPSITPSEQDKE